MAAPVGPTKMNPEKSSVPADVVRKVASDFPNEPQANVLALLDEYAGPERSRVVRCVVHLAEGSPDKLRDLIASAKNDYRDVIYGAEYDGSDRRIRDFNQPFPTTPSGTGRIPPSFIGGAAVPAG